MLSLHIAGFAIKIVFSPTEWPEKKGLLVDLIRRYFGPFISTHPNKADAIISIKEISGIPFINKDGIHFNQYFEQTGRNSYTAYYHISIFELSYLLLFIILSLMGKKGFLLHSSSVSTAKGIALFMGKSGAGKSTTMEMLKDSFPPFSDDCVAIKKQGEEYVCYQVPWIEKDSSLMRLTQKSEKIVAIFDLVKNKSFAIQKIDKSHIFHQMALNVWTIDGLSKDALFAVGEFVNLEKNVLGARLYLSKNDKGRLIKEVSVL